MYKRGNSWVFRTRKGGQDKRISLGQDYQEACRIFRRLKAGEAITPRLSVAQAVPRWVELYVQTARNAKGAAQEEARAKRYLIPFLGHKQLGKVTRDDLRAYRLWLEKKPIAIQTVHHILGSARCFFYWCLDSGYIDRSPVPRRLLPRIQERPPDRLTEEELEAIIRLPDPHGFVARFAVGTGLRWGELCRAQRSHIEDGMLVVSRTKTGRVRRVPLSQELLAELHPRVGKLVPFSIKASGAYNRYVRRESGVDRFHVHQMRHTFACRWLEKGGSLAALQQILGHSTIVTTQRYARLTDEHVRREAERLEGIL